jgi:putative membrane protein
MIPFLLLGLIAGGWNAALAQTVPSAPEKGAPQAGANSFTESQARDRIEKAGFTEITGLRKDEQGIWRGRAKQGDRQVAVALDFRGSVTAQ